MRTPLRPSPWLSHATGADVRLKIETLQPTYSYKIRGAFNAVLHLLEERTSRGTAAPALVTASAGNHGRALAHAARESGIPLTVYVSASAPRVKLAGMREAGADVRLCADYDEAERQAKRHGMSGQATFISPYAHPDVIAGAGTVGLEILEDFSGVDAIVVPIGGGGLIAGIALAVQDSGARVYGVEVSASSPFTASLAAGRIVEVVVGETLADGLAGNMDPDTPTFDIVRRHVERVVLIDEGTLASAVAGVVNHEHLVAEGAGAAGVAGLLSSQLSLQGRRVAVVLSGANIDSDVLKRLI